MQTTNNQAAEGDWSGGFLKDLSNQMIISLNTLEVRFARLVLTEIQGMMRRECNQGTGSATLDICEIKMKMLERWANRPFIDLPESKGATKQTCQPRSNLSTDRVSI